MAHRSVNTLGINREGIRKSREPECQLRGGKGREFQEKEQTLETVRPNKEKKERDEIGLEKRRFRDKTQDQREQRGRKVVKEKKEIRKRGREKKKVVCSWPST